LMAGMLMFRKSIRIEIVLTKYFIGELKLSFIN